MYRTIVVGVTSHQTALRATEHALDVARAAQADVHLVYAIGGEADGSGSADVARRHAEGLLEGISLANRRPVELHVVADRPDRAILDVADRSGADLIVIGNQGLGGGRFSSTPAARVVRGARCSVLLVDTAPAAD